MAVKVINVISCLIRPALVVYVMFICPTVFFANRTMHFYVCFNVLIAMGGHFAMVTYI